MCWFFNKWVFWLRHFNERNLRNRDQRWIYCITSIIVWRIWFFQRNTFILRKKNLHPRVIFKWLAYSLETLIFNSCWTLFCAVLKTFVNINIPFLLERNQTWFSFGLLFSENRNIVLVMRMEKLSWVFQNYAIASKPLYYTLT